MISLEPGTRYPYVLKSCVGKTPAPTFYFKSLSARQMLKPRAALNRLVADAGDEDANLNLLVDAIATALVDWSDCGAEFNIETLADICTLSELYELLGNICRDGVTVDDKKKSD